MKTKFNITGMHCDSCAADIRETLEETAGVERVDVSYEDKQAIINYDENVTQPQTFIKKIQDLGYTLAISGDSQSEVRA